MIPETLPGALGVLSAMITPAILILACGSLILATSARMGRVIDRVREIAREFELVASLPEARPEQKKLLFKLLSRTTTRARLIQRALTWLYLALSFFIGTSVAIGVIAALRLPHAWIPLTSGFIGALLLLSASFLLIAESRIGLGSVYAEMDYVWSTGRHLAPELEEKRGMLRWRRKRPAGD
jgi:hypothetical protein